MTIFIDLGSINSYLAINPSRELMDDFGLSVEWLPINGIVKRAAQRKPVIAENDDLAEIKLRRMQAKLRDEVRELERNAKLLNIPKIDATKVYNTNWSHIGLLYLNYCEIDPLGYIEQVFNWRFKKGRELDTQDSICSLLEDFNIEKEGFLAFAMESEMQLDILQNNTIQSGIFDSPAYQFDGQNYQGRAHLPLLRWRLSGANGTAPV